MKTLLVFLLVFNSHYLIAQDLYPVWNSYFRDTVCNSEYRGNCGYKNIKNEIAIPLKYCRCGTFYNNLAIVEINGLKGMIDTNNRLIIPIKYAKIVGFNTIIPYSEKSLKTLFIARKTVSDDSGFIYNLAGEVVFKGRFSDAYSITDKNLILLENKNPYPYSKDNKYTIDLFDYQFKILFSLKSNTYIRGVKQSVQRTTNQKKP